MLNLQPGATFRHLVTLYEAGRDSPRLDVTTAVITVVNLDPAPWNIQALVTDPTNGQFQLWASDVDTRLAKEFTNYAFQIRLLWPTGDVQIIGPITITTGSEFLLMSPLPAAEEAVELVRRRIRAVGEA